MTFASALASWSGIPRALVLEEEEGLTQDAAAEYTAFGDEVTSVLGI